MRRRSFNGRTVTGLAMAVVLLVAGGLLMWGSTYVHNTVHGQLAAQKIYFPPKGSPELAPRQIGPYLDQYAGQQLLTGQQAEAYADHFIAVHLQAIGGGQTYAQLSARSLAQPKNAALALDVQTVFRGQTLRGLLLNAYGWWKVSQITFIAAIAAFALAGLALIGSGIGIAHGRRTKPETEPQPKLAPQHSAKAA